MLCTCHALRVHRVVHRSRENGRRAVSAEGARIASRKRVARPTQFGCESTQSKPGPGSRLRSGATCSCPATTSSRIARRARRQQTRERRVLRGLEGLAFEALELDADRVVVAGFAATPDRTAGVPSACVARHELDDLAVTPHEEVGGDGEAADALIVRMRIEVEPVGEQPLDRIATVLARRQADGVDDDKCHRRIDGVRRRSATPRGGCLRASRRASPARPRSRVRARRACAGLLASAHSRSTCSAAAGASPPTFTPRRAMR